MRALKKQLVWIGLGVLCLGFFAFVWGKSARWNGRYVHAYEEKKASGSYRLRLDFPSFRYAGTLSTFEGDAESLVQGYFWSFDSTLHFYCKRREIEHSQLVSVKTPCGVPVEAVAAGIDLDGMLLEPAAEEP